jgi:hypothetical protein
MRPYRRFVSDGCKDELLEFDECHKLLKSQPLLWQRADKKATLLLKVGWRRFGGEVANQQRG